MRVIIAIGLLAVAATGVPEDDFCIPTDNDHFNEVFKEPIPGQYEWSKDGLHFICAPWDNYNAYFNMTMEKRLMQQPENKPVILKKLQQQW